jgi:hypothetical protein
VRVDVEREGGRVVPEALLGDPGVNSAGHEHRPVCVAHVVQADRRQARGLHVAAEHRREPVGVERLAVLAGEDLILILVGRAEGQALGGLPAAVRPQDVHGGGGEVYHADPA